MKGLRVLLLPPEWDASSSQGYTQQFVTGTHLYTRVERDNVGQGLGVEPPTLTSSNALTTTLLRPTGTSKDEVLRIWCQKKIAG